MKDYLKKMVNGECNITKDQIDLTYDDSSESLPKYRIKLLIGKYVWLNRMHRILIKFKVKRIRISEKK